MVVVGLIVLMTMIALPAFRGVGASGRLRAAVFQVSANLALARQSSISSRMDVHFLLPDSDVSFPEGYSRLAFTSYALATGTNRVGATMEYITGWNELPPGMIFNPDEGPADRNIFLQSSTYEVTVPFPSQTSPLENMLALTFRPDGTLDRAGFTPKSIYVSEGYLDDTLNPQYVSDVLFEIEIVPVTGQTRIREH